MMDTYNRDSYIRDKGHPPGGWESLDEKFAYYLSQGGGLDRAHWNVAGWPGWPGDEDEGWEDRLARGEAPGTSRAIDEG